MRGRLKLQKVIHEDAGDALLAEKIAVRAKRIDLGKTEQGSSKHKIQPLTLEGQVFCIIDIPLAWSRSGQSPPN
jgi:hypothetical protein